MTTAKDIEKDLKRYVGGSFIRPGELAAYLGQKKTQHVKKYLEGVFHPEGTKTFFIPEVAENIYKSGGYE